jgi:hypothetical protein
MKLPKPLKCSEAGRDEILRDLIECRLDESTEDMVLAHLRNCPYCLSILARVYYSKRQGETCPGMEDEKSSKSRDWKIDN